MSARLPIYKTIKQWEPGDLDAAVEGFLRNGWQLYGDPTVAWTPVDESFAYFQTVVNFPKEGA